jgi:hypothetical protein
MGFGPRDAERVIAVITVVPRIGGGIQYAAASPRHCERSEAIHLSAERMAGLPRRFAPRNDVVRHALLISRRDAPEVFHFVVPRNQRAQGRPGARCTRGLACDRCEEICTRAYRFSGEHSGLPCAMALRLIRFRPGDRLSCHHHPLEALASHELDASTGASDPNDFAVRVCHARQSQPSRPPLPAPRLRRWPTPLAGQDGVVGKVFLPDGGSGIFFREGLDHPNHVDQVQEIGFCAQRPSRFRRAFLGRPPQILGQCAVRQRFG